jgi:hypothetical protein
LGTGGSVQRFSLSAPGSDGAFLEVGSWTRRRGRFRPRGDSTVGSLAFPADVSADQLCHASSSRHSSLASSRRFSFEDSLGLSRPFFTTVTEVFVASRLPLLVSSKIASPSTSALCVHSRLPEAQELPHSQARSVHVVSHDFDGLLHTELCRFVAPCYRP